MRARIVCPAVILCGLVAAWASAGQGTPATSPSPPAVHRPLSVRDAPGYVPLRDPDSLDDVLGRRRNAPRVDMAFRGGARTLPGLGRAVCRALHTMAPDSMLELCVKSEEFRVILWPEFPQSRAATGLRWDDGWQILWGRLNGGSVASVREFGDHYWEFVKIEYVAVVPYRNFRLYNGITITAKNDEGRTESFTFIRSIAERGGRFKIYSMRD